MEEWKGGGADSDVRGTWLQARDIACETRKLSETGNFFLPRSWKGNERLRRHCQLIEKEGVMVGWVWGEWLRGGHLHFTCSFVTFEESVE